MLRARLSELTAFNAIAEHRGFRAAALMRGKSAAIDAKGPLTPGNLNLMVDAALAGIGIAWVPENIASGHIASGPLVRVLAPWSPAFPGLCRDYRANRHPPAAVRLFVAAVRE